MGYLLSNLLVVDDVPARRDARVRLLEEDGHAVRAASGGAEALRLAERAPPALVILERELSGLSGTELCRRLRAAEATAAVGVLFLSASADEIDRVVAFEVGADDILSEPYHPRELLLRVRAILRRVRVQPARLGVAAPGLTVDPELGRARIGDAVVTLSRSELRLLQALAQRGGGLVSRAELSHQVWGSVPPEEHRSLDTLLRRLRARLGPERDRLVTVRGVGYRLDTDGLGPWHQTR